MYILSTSMISGHDTEGVFLNRNDTTPSEPETVGTGSAGCQAQADPAVAQFARFLSIVKQLRGPEGCPWDREQTPETLKRFLVEESFECVDAISRGNRGHAREELGDVFLIVSMIAYVYQQEGSFTVEAVLAEIADKLVRRHPHVFGESRAEDSAAVKAQWDDIKANVEGKAAKGSLLDAVSRGFPPLEVALRLQKKAAKVGFDWASCRPVIAKVQEELSEIEAVLAQSEPRQAGDNTGSEQKGEEDRDVANHERLEQEAGDLLFAAVNLARKAGVDPTLALHRCNESFRRRFAFVERGMQERGLEMHQEQLAIMDELWNAAKTAPKRC